MADPEWAEFKQLNSKTIIRPRSDFLFDFDSGLLQAVGANLNLDFVLGVEYRIGDIVFNASDSLFYRCILATDAVAPDYTDTNASLYWAWVSGSISGEVTGRGWWQRTADGTQICRQVFSAATSRTWTYPLEFYAAPAVIPSAIADSTGRWCDKNTVTASSCIIKNWSAAGASSTAADVIALGRWKE